MELHNFFKKKEIKNTAQNSCEFNQKNTRKKFLKIFAAASLALITCATTLLATTPFGTSAANAATNPNLSNTTQTTSPLGLDAENDPVLFTTSSGLEIKFGGATLESGTLNGYTYFTMGKYDNVDVNWVIIGRHSQGFDVTGGSLASYLVGLSETNDTLETWVHNYLDLNTPAGKALEQDKILHDPINIGTRFLLSSKESTNPNIDLELNPGEVLAISENTVGYTKFADEETTINYDSDVCLLRRFIEDLYTTNLGLSPNQQASIVPKTLKTLYINNSGVRSIRTTVDARIFTLGRIETDSHTDYPQNFCYQTYNINLNVALSNATYWTRTPVGSQSMAYIFAGSLNYNMRPNYSYSVRPCFVLDLA